jgi:hypothetical protein
MEKIKFDKVGFNLHQGVCESNGLKVIVAPVFGATEVKAGLYIDRGGLARDYFIGSTKIYPGTADLLVKSLLKKHTEASEPLFDKDVEVKGYVEESFTTISYKAKTEKAKDLLEPLLSLVNELNISNDEVEILKTSFEQEIVESDKDFPNMIRRNLYINSPMGKNPNGEIETLSKVHLVALKRYFEAFYQVSNMTLIVSGNISPDDVYEVANAHKFTKTYSDKDIRIQPNIEPENSVSNQITYEAPENTLVLGLKFPKREVMFNLFGDHLFSYYSLLQSALFSKTNKKTMEVLKDVVDVKIGGIKQGGEDAFLYQVFEVGDMDKGMEEVKALLSSSKLITRSDFKKLKSEYFKNSIEAYKNDVSKYFNMLCEDYANRFASQAITNAVKVMKYSKFTHFLSYILKAPVSFIAEKK